MKHRFNVTVEAHETFFTAKVKSDKEVPAVFRSPAFGPDDSHARKDSLIRMLGDIGSVIGYRAFPSAMILDNEKNGTDHG